MDERFLLEHIRTRSLDLGQRFPQIAVGPGDDCAVIRTPRGDSLLVTVDHLIEGVHVKAPIGTATPIDLAARKAMARSVSDIAAMGGTPMAATATAAIPSGTDDAWATSLFDAMAAWAIHFRCPLVGGDIASLPAGAAGCVLTTTVIGLPHARRGPVLRSAARDGDLVYVTGHIGGSLSDNGLGHHLDFTPRVDEATWLCHELGSSLHAMIDVSDGLAIDLSRLARASGVTIEIDAGLVPLRDPSRGWMRSVADGEDYELAFAASPEIAVAGRVPRSGTPITRIGRVRAGGSGGLFFLSDDGARLEADRLGWVHGVQG